MKILIVIPYFHPAYSYGGPVRVSFDISRTLVALGHEVMVATTDVLDAARRSTVREEVVDGVRILRFRNVSNILAKRYNGYLPLGFVRWASQHIQEFDFVYCHDFFTVQNILAGWFCTRHNIPFIVQPHGCLSTTRRKARFYRIKGLFAAAFGTILKRAYRFVALTNEEKESFLQVLPDLSGKIEVIPNGLDLSQFEKIAPVDVHERYGIPEGITVIAFVGRLSYIKGIDISLKLLASLRESSRFAFLIIGPDDGERSRLELLAHELSVAERVRFAGLLEGEEKLQIMKSCDFFLFTSRDEGLPMTILEIAALGVPQVVSSECNVPEIRAYDAGFVHDVNDAPAFVASLDFLLEHPEERRRLGLNARRMAEELFDIRKTSGSLLRLMDNSRKG